MLELIFHSRVNIKGPYASMKKNLATVKEIFLDTLAKKRYASNGKGLNKKKRKLRDQRVKKS